MSFHKPNNTSEFSEFESSNIQKTVKWIGKSFFFSRLIKYAWKISHLKYILKYIVVNNFAEGNETITSNSN